MQKVTVLIALTVFVFLCFGSCKKTEVTNPYTNVVDVVDNDNPDIDDLPEGSFAWLHA